MLNLIKSFTDKIKTGAKINTPKFKQYLKNLDSGTDRVLSRNRKFVKDPIPSAGIDFINGLIIRADLKYLLKHSNDMDRFIRIQKEYQGPAYSDFIRQYPIKESAFCYSEIMKTTEYCLITDDYDLLDNLPIGSNAISEWAKIKPFRLISMYTTELRLDNAATRLRYEYLPPIEAVFSINIPALLMLYTKYRLLNPKEFETTTNNYPFIYRFCILPLLNDLKTTWITTIIRDIVSNKIVNPEYTFDTSNLMFSDKSYFASASIKQALKEIEDLIDKVIDGSTKPDVLVSSLNLSSNLSIADAIGVTRDNYYISNGGVQYYWMTFIKEFAILSLVTDIYKLQYMSTRTDNLKKIMEIKSKRLNNTKFWQHVKNPMLKESIREKFESIQF